MANQRTNEKVSAQYFTWGLRKRNGVFFADGRACTPNLGRHSLATRDREMALKNLTELDRLKAVEHGLADPSILEANLDSDLPLENGRQLYMEYAQRPRVVGGIRPSSAKRYRAVFDKFIDFAQNRGIHSWNQVNTRSLQHYAKYLETVGYAYRTQYLELTTLKQVVSWLVKNKYLPTDHLLELPLSKPDGTDTYCWKQAELMAILEHCKRQEELNWLGHLLLTLTVTGLRISELRNLRWKDIDFEKQMIHLSDETSSGRAKKKAAKRTLKGGRGRNFPIHDKLLPILSSMKQAHDGYVFHGPAGGRIKADTVRRILIRDVLKPLDSRFPSAEDEVGFKDGRLHSFRHFFCSWCANQGISQQVVMQWLGHRESKMVQHYYHLHDEEARRQMQRLKLFDDLDGDQTISH
ncbi:Site-specific tyrosine recombinase XerD [Planctomycetales bacterium 10988]|nr:Site-specific tyrosine recombinase XerD [Planctomycetales bacterium 10988]